MQETISKLTQELDSAGLSLTNLDIDECLAFISDLVLSDSEVASENPEICKILNQLAGARPSRKVLESFWTSKKIEDKVKLLPTEHFKTKGAKVTIILKKQPKKIKVEPIKQEISTPVNSYIKHLDFYNKITSKGCANTQYGWQYRLSGEDYSKLKEIIEEIDLSSDSLPSFVYRLIAIYLGEFYKREYASGQKMGDRFSTSLCKTIINNTGIPAYSHKIQSNKEDCQNNISDVTEREQTSWLHSIYVNGGLPIKAICDGKQKGISRLFVDIFSHSDEDWEIYLHDFLFKIKDDKVLASLALKQSLLKRESLYQLLIQLRNREPIFAKEDLENPTGIFSEFMELVANGRKESERKKGKLMYELWYDIDGEQTFSLTPILHLSPEEDGKRHYAISPERLDVWGISDTDKINYFTLSFTKDGDPVVLYDEDFHTIDTILFNKCQKGDYIEFDARNRFYFPQLDEKDLNIDSLFLKNCKCCFSGGGQEIYINLLPNKEDYIQLYSNDRKFWISSKGNVPYKYSALIFRNTKDSYLKTGDYELIGSGLAWTVFESYVTLVIKGTERRIYNTQGKVYAVPSKSFTHKLCESPFIPNLNGGQVKYRAEDSIESVYLVNNTDVLFDVFWEKDNKQINSGYKTYISSGSNQEYKEYKKGEVLPVGYIHFKFNVLDKYTTEVPCFVLPDNCSVNMDLISNKIIFRDIQLNVSHNKHLINKVGNSYTFQKRGFSDNELTKDGGYLTFEIQDKGGSIEITTPYPIEGIFYKLISGTTINSKIRKIRTLPLAYIGYCRKIEINNNGANFTRVSSAIPKIYKYVLEQNRDRILPNNETGRADGTTHFVAYSGMFEKTGRLYKIPGSCKIRSGSFYYLNLKTLKTHGLTVFENRTIDLSDYKDEGILFQSLKSKQPLDFYLRPEYIPNIDSSKNIDKDRAKRERIASFTKNREFLKDDAFKTFMIASEHGLYFSAFDILLSLIHEADGHEIPYRVCQFLYGYYEFCSKRSIAIDYAGLWRLAKEFLFDWLFIPTRFYTSARVNTSLVKELFKARPEDMIDDNDEYQRFIEWLDSTKEKLRGYSVKNSMITDKFSMFNKEGNKPLLDTRCEFLSKVYQQSFKEINNNTKLS